MNNVYLTLFFLCVVLSKISGQIDAHRVSIMTYNIKYDDKYDEVNNWNKRKMTMVQLFQYYKPDFIGTQEGLRHQIEYIDSSMTNYSMVGVGRDYGDERGEHCSIFFNTEKYKVEYNETYWLSSTPNFPSKDWDAAYKRIVTVAKFRNVKTNKFIWVANAHYDHIGESARQNSSMIIRKLIDSLHSSDDALVLMGDFNATADKLEIKTLASYLKDALADENMLYGPKGTFTGFTEKIPLDRIDYIFSNSSKPTISYRHIDDRMANYEFISDHLPVFAEIEW